MLPILLLVCSNLFMTAAWYGHLKWFKSWELWAVVLVSWGIAFFEYVLQVPANRIGYKSYTATQLKIIQEAISIAVFLLFGYVVLRESPTWRTGLAFALIFAAVIVAMGDKKTEAEQEVAAPK